MQQLLHIVGLTRICRFSPRIQRFSSRRELLFSDQQRKLQFSSRRELLFSYQQRKVQYSSRRELLFFETERGCFFIWTNVAWTNNFLTLYSSIWSVLGLFEPFYVNLFIYLELPRSFKASL